MRVAVAQLTSTTLPDENLRLVREYAGRAVAAGADLVLFPEATMASFATRSAEVAEPLDGPFAHALRSLAAELDVVLAVGMFTLRDAGGPPRNTLYLTGRGVEASYDKIHLFDVEGFAESDHITAGDDPVTVEVGGFRVGLSVCYDVRFPELYKHYAAGGAEVVLVPASWRSGDGKAEQWRALAKARAMDGTVYIVACDQADPAASGGDGSSWAPLGVGNSLVVDPLGTVVADAGTGPELLVVDLDKQAVAAARSAMPVIANTRFRTRPPG